MTDQPTGRDSRETAARRAILASHGTTAGEYGATLFVTHHLEVLDPEYWWQHLGTHTPSADQVLGLLQLLPDSDEEMMDFALPDGISDYLLSVTFDEAGDIEDVGMES